MQINVLCAATLAAELRAAQSLLHPCASVESLRYPCFRVRTYTDLEQHHAHAFFATLSLAHLSHFDFIEVSRSLSSSLSRFGRPCRFPRTGSVFVPTPACGRIRRRAELDLLFFTAAAPIKRLLLSLNLAANRHFAFSTGPSHCRP